MVLSTLRHCLLVCLAAAAAVCLLLGGRAAGQVNCPTVSGASLYVGSQGTSNQYTLAANLSLFPTTSVIVACSAGTSASAFQALNAGTVDALSINDDNSFYRQYDGLGAYQWLATQDNTLGHRVLAIQNITSYAQLRGKNIAVDAVVSGWLNEFVSIAAVNGLEPGAYNLIPVGGTRYPYLLSGSWTNASGYTFAIHATVVSTPQTITYTTDVGATGRPTNLGLVSDYFAPVTGNAITVTPALQQNAQKSAAMVDYLTGLLLGNYVMINPANQQLVTQVLGAAGGYTATQAAELYQLLFNPVNGVPTVDPNLRFISRNNLQLAFLRQRTGGLVGGPAQNFTALIQPGPGRFIDYTLLNQAITAATAKATISVALPHELASVTCFPNFGLQPITLRQSVTSIAAYVSGGCSAPQVTFLGCNSTDPTAAPSECEYDAKRDVLSVAAVLPAGRYFPGEVRAWSAYYTATDLCGRSQPVIVQHITVRVPVSLRETQSAQCPSVVV